MMLYRVKNAQSQTVIDALVTYGVLTTVDEPVFVYRECMTHKCKSARSTLSVIHDCVPGYVEMFGGAYEES